MAGVPRPRTTGDGIGDHIGSLGRIPFRRSAAIALLALVASLLPPSGGPAITTAMQSPSAASGGELLYVNRGDIWRLDLATQEQRLLIHPPMGIITRLAHSPDRRRLAYSVLNLDQMYRVLGGEIVVSDANGDNPRTAVREEEAGFSLGWPTWTADPSKLTYVKENVTRATIVQRVEEVDLTTGERTLAVEGGSSPAASPTANRLVYLTRVADRHAAWSMDRTSGEIAQLIDPAWFEDADNPVYSPDGQSLAFVGVGAGPSPTSFLPRALASLFRLTEPTVAHAHDMPGILFDLWVMQAGGGGLRRVAPFVDMQPEIAWSPDSRQIAVFGVAQLQIIDVATGAKTNLTRPNGSGQLSWGTGGN